MPGEDFLTQLLTTPGGVLILVQSLIVALAVLMMAVSTVRQPKKTETDTATETARRSQKMPC